jgi:hypothetical protein
MQAIAISLRIQTVTVNAPRSRYPIIAVGRFPACPGPGGLWFHPVGFPGENQTKFHNDTSFRPRRTWRLA